MKKNEIIKAETALEIKKSPLFKKRTATKGEQSIKLLTDFALIVPGLVESIPFETKYVVDMPAEIASQIQNGTLTFLKKTNGDMMATVKNPATHKIVKNLPIRSELASPALGPAMLAAGLFIQMKKIEKGIDELNEGIGEILQNFENDRYARAFAAKEKFEQALLFTDDKMKQSFLLNILADVTNTKHMLYKQLTDKAEKLINSKTRFNDKSKSELADQVLQNLYLFNECFKIQIQCYSELEQHYSLSHALDMYEHEINTVLTKEVQLAVDGYFKDPTNPFSHTITEVITSVYQTNDFLLDNETIILEQSAQPANQFAILKEQEMGITYD
ncbi:hypothetical protein ACWN8V_12870 [Vagococcus elongatus]|uniref:Uncharacterized protein n=1 Tax=Vagococcus elongatus TaxID=180344 RepID=A0A430B0Z6_9ENTE|nr:hypothetical protein [Vagococcus elongatus]RSU13988.1 hypothetical protein CBF29_03635 [Vagococcus elongatus]